MGATDEMYEADPAIRRIVMENVREAVNLFVGWQGERDSEAARDLVIAALDAPFAEAARRGMPYRGMDAADHLRVVIREREEQRGRLAGEIRDLLADEARTSADCLARWEGGTDDIAPWDGATKLVNARAQYRAVGVLLDELRGMRRRLGGEANGQ
jgi:hypothetical protein